MTKTCPLFGKCGGCKYDFTASDYRSKKSGLLRGINQTQDAIWIAPGTRRRADFCFAPNAFGFFQSKSKNIIPVEKCPNLSERINQILPQVASLPWGCAGSCLITECENGIDISITSDVPYFTNEFRNAANLLPAIRITWNGKVIKQTEIPQIKFGDHIVEYPSGAFLQPSVIGADVLRELVITHTRGYTRIADLFCGLGNFTFATNATGFDIVGTGIKRNLFTHPLTVGMLNQYDCVIMDPPRSGANAQCHELVHSAIKRIIYISCNPTTFTSDSAVLTDGGYKIKNLTPIDQFCGSTHWEIFSVFEK